MPLQLLPFEYDSDVLQFWLVQAQCQRAAMNAIASYMG